MTEIPRHIPIPDDAEPSVRDFNRTMGKVVPELADLKVTVGRVSGNPQKFVVVSGPEKAKELYGIIIESMCYQDSVAQASEQDAFRNDLEVYSPFHDQTRL